MIELKNISKVYNEVKAVSNLSLTVADGENIVLLGTSGCGKTTTLRMINRLTESSSGSIVVNNINILKQSPEKLRQGIGYVLQHNGLFPHYTVNENIAIVPTLLKWTKSKIEDRTHELLDKLRLPHKQFANLFPAQLSGGQQQRVGLARALAADPPILLMDEPFGALDPVTRTSIRKEFSELEEFKKKTIVLVTHDVQEAFTLGDRICLMHQGTIVQVGTPAELLFEPVNDFVESFFNEHRLVLELQAVNLNQIFDALPVTTQSGEAVSTDTNLWEALQLLQSGTAQLCISFGGQNKSVDASSLMSAFTKYKNQHHG